MSDTGSALAARIRAELIELEQVTQRVEHLLVKVQNDEDYLDGVALNLHGFYTGVERIFTEIAREVDGSLPAGPDRRRGLLRQMTAAVTNTRPAIIDANTRACLDEYRRFRSAVRNVYTFNLRPARLQALVEALRPCYNDFASKMRTFCEFLDALSWEE